MVRKYRVISGVAVINEKSYKVGEIAEIDATVYAKFRTSIECMVKDCVLDPISKEPDPSEAPKESTAETVDEKIKERIEDVKKDLEDDGKRNYSHDPKRKSPGRRKIKKKK